MVRTTSVNVRTSWSQTVGRISQGPCFETVHERLLRDLNDPLAHLPNMARCAQSDPALCRALISRANSNGPMVRTVDAALGSLSPAAVRAQIVTVAMERSLLAGTRRIGPYCRSQLGTHLHATARLAQVIAQRTESVDPDKARLVGLLHDVGLLLLDHFDPGRLAAVIARMDEGMDLDSAEKEVLGFNHAALGAWFCRSRLLGEDVAAAVGQHHAAAIQAAAGALAATCQIANVLASAAVTSSLPGRRIQLFETALNRLGLTEPEFRLLARDALAEVRGAA